MAKRKKEKTEDKSIKQDNVESKIDIATQTLERNIVFITNCDNKTSIVLTSVGVLLTIILTNNGVKEIRRIIGNCLDGTNFCDVLYLFIFITSICVLLVGMFLLGSVLIAKTDGKERKLDSTKSNIFFSGIQQNPDCRTYRGKFITMEDTELLDDLIEQIYINANIAQQKYYKYNRGLRLTVMGFTMFVILFFVGVYLY